VKVRFAPDVDTGLFLPSRGMRPTKMRRRTVKLTEGLLRDTTGDRAPVCCICQHPVEYEAIVDEKPRATEVLVRCHGSEEHRTFEHEAFDDEDVRADMLATRMARWRWFDPEDTNVTT